MDALMREIAENEAQYAVDHWGRHLPKEKQLKLFDRYYDVIISALMTFAEVDGSRRLRARAMVSEN